LYGLPPNIKGKVIINDFKQLAQMGIVLINLGTPFAPTTSAVRQYLREFLSDSRVVELPRWLWLPLLYCVVLILRPPKSAKKYQQIWTSRGSPLSFHTQDQAQALQRELLDRGLSHLHVTYAMRYGSPHIQEAIDALITQGCKEIMVLPLYPQYAASSTASALDAVYTSLQSRRDMPALYTINTFYDNPGYITALKNQIHHYWQQHGQGEHLVMSFHGVPVATIKKGDPYFDQCMGTAASLASALALEPHQYTVAFQSRFGKAEWLKPSTDEILKHLAQTGIKKLDIVCPGFVADCLETLEEIAIEGKQIFELNGGSVYHYIPCLNKSEDWIKALADLCQQQLPARLCPYPS
jgi:ferrochelatase